MLFFLAFSLKAQEGEKHTPIKVWLNMEGVELSRQTLSRYQNILSEAFDREVRFSKSGTPDSEIRISNQFFASGTDNWINSRYMIDVVPALTITRRKDSALLPSPVIAVVRRSYQYLGADNRYLLDDMNTALHMLENKRVDAIVDYANEGVFYVHNKPHLVQEQLHEQQSVRVYFRTLQMVRHFEEVMGQLVGVEKNSTAIIDDVRPLTEMEASMADSLVLYQIPKQFDISTNQLVVTDTDSAISKWLTDNLEQFNVDIRQSNTNGAYEQLTGNDNVCILNTGKSEKRKNLALYTLPTYTYLDYQIYVNAGGLADQLLAAATEGSELNSVDIAAFLKRNAQGLVGYYEYIDRTQPYDSYIKPMIETAPERFISLSAKDEIKALTLLETGRIDYLIIFPFVLQNHIDTIPYINQLKSYSFVNYDTAKPTYIACSKSSEGERFVEAVNALMQSKTRRDVLIAVVAEKMIPSDREALVRMFRELYPE